MQVFQRVLRLTQLGVNKAASAALERLRIGTAKIEIQLDRIGQLQIAPPGDAIAYPVVDLETVDDPIPAILQAPAFQETDAYFATSPASSRSLVSARSQALLYSLIRNAVPDHIIEIGTYKAATTEAMCRAVAANGHGTVHTVDPFRTEYIAAIARQWPADLLKHLQIHPTDSMTFFFGLRKQTVRPGLVLVDGNHDYEFASFDIAAAARYLTFGGFIVVDNIPQPGPFRAAHEFLAANPDWIECGAPTAAHDKAKAFDRDRCAIPGTEFIVMRSPKVSVLHEQPRCFGSQRRFAGHIRGVRITPVEPTPGGVLHAQIVLRGFGVQQTESTVEASVRLDGATGPVTVPFEPPISLKGPYVYFAVEPWMSWQSERPLRLAAPPELV